MANGNAARDDLAPTVSGPEPGCHPDCVLGPNADHPGYIGYRCIDEHVNTLPFPGEAYPYEADEADE